MTSPNRQRRIRILLWIFIVGLVVSGATAIPLETEVNLILRALEASSLTAPGQTEIVRWLTEVRDGLVSTYATFPFLAYGTDWLAFGHFVIAIAFIGPLRDPLRNAWIVDFGIVACVLVIPFALGMGALRGIPLWWRFVDCSFGVFGIIPLWLCRREIQMLAKVSLAAPCLRGRDGNKR